MLSTQRFTTALRETFQEAADAISQRVKNIPHLDYLKYAAPLPLVGAGILFRQDPSLLLDVANQCIGAVGATLAATAPMHRNNEHIRMQMMVGQGLFAGHMAMLGADSAAIVSGVTAVRCAYQGMVGDDNYMLKTIGGVTGLAAATGIYVATHEVDPILSISNVPLAVMAFTTAAEAMPSSKSYISRILYGGSATMMAGYHALESGSISGVVLNTLSTVLTGRSIWKHDLQREEAADTEHVKEVDREDHSPSA